MCPQEILVRAARRDGSSAPPRICASRVLHTLRTKFRAQQERGAFAQAASGVVGVSSFKFRAALFCKAFIPGCALYIGHRSLSFYDLSRNGILGGTLPC